MRKIVLIIIVFSLNINLFSQTNMIIRKIDNSIISIPILDIDSIYYETISEFTCGDQITDIDGNTYNTVEIGSQCWMAENLAVTKYPNGDPITNLTDNTEWGDLEDNNNTDYYCYFNNNANNEGETFGALYTYAAAIAHNWEKDNVDNQGICPDGWHLPSDAEWEAIINHLGGSDIAGGKMKEAGTVHWDSPNTGADNSSGFTALPAGYRSGNVGVFGNWKAGTCWWSSTPFDDIAGAVYILYNIANAENEPDAKSCGFSVRCVKN